ncbi:numb-related protein 1-like isoform X2 [Dendrobates tinctorius]|uniref:numb-related protein 1-like isoform X2 n=1 Tax=Dendrobates tinctorius TaxID=92724 RepID=UPI003CCA416D
MYGVPQLYLPVTGLLLSVMVGVWGVRRPSVISSCHRPPPLSNGRCVGCTVSLSYILLSPASSSVMVGVWGVRRPSVTSSCHRSPALSELADTWPDSRDALLDGVVFHLKYLGMTLVEEPKGEDMAAAAIRRIVTMARASAKPLQKVTLTVTPHSITIQDAGAAPQTECVSIYRISYCTTDKVQNKVFAYVAQNPSSGALECHAFLSPKKKLAQTVTMTVAQAFSVALDLWQSSKEGRLESSPGSHNVASSSRLDASEPRPDDHDTTVMAGPHVPEKGAPHKDGKDEEDCDDFEDFSRWAEIRVWWLGPPEAVT